MPYIKKIKINNTTYDVKDALAEEKSNKVTSISSASTDIQYPSAKAVWNTKIPEASFADTASTAAIADLADNLTPNLTRNADEKIGALQSTADGADVETVSARFEKLQGISIAWNQLCQNNATTETIDGVTFTNNGDGSWTVNGTATADASKAVTPYPYPTIFTPNHKFLLLGCPIGGSAETYHILENNNAKYDYGEGVIFTAQDNPYNQNISIVVKNGTTVNNLVFKPRVFDLTLMFGNNERIPTELLNGKTEGGVTISAPTCFNRMFPNYPIAYNAGEIISCKPTNYKMVGYNAFDGELEHGRYNITTGLPDIGYPEYVRNKNKIKVIPSQKYTLSRTESCLGYLYEYDNSQNFIKSTYLSTSTTNDITLSPQTQYINFSLGNTFTTTFPTNVCLHLTWSGSKTGYEEYQTKSYALGGEELKGIYGVSGDEKLPNGKITRKYGIVDLGTLNWTYYNGQKRFATNSPVSGMKLITDQQLLQNLICSKFSTLKQYYVQGNVSNKVTATYNGYIYVVDLDYTDAAAFKAAMAGVYLIYELATPTEENGIAYEEYALADDYGTQEITGSIVPTGAKIEYKIDLKSFIQRTYLNMAGNADNIKIVQANPTLTGAETSLTSLQVGKEKYKIPRNTIEVIESIPSSLSDENLSRLYRIESALGVDNIYNIEKLKQTEYSATACTSGSQLTESTVLQNFDDNKSAVFGSGVVCDIARLIYGTKYSIEGEIINPIRIGTKEAGCLGFDFVTAGTYIIKAGAYFSYNGSTHVKTYDQNVSLILSNGVDPEITVQLSNEPGYYSIDASSSNIFNLKNIADSSSAKRVFIYGIYRVIGDPVYSAKELATKEFVNEQVAIEHTYASENINSLDNRVSINETSITNLQAGLEETNEKIGDVQIWKTNELPMASEAYFDKILKVDDKLYKISRTGAEGTTKLYDFSTVTMTPTVTDASFSTFADQVDGGFKYDFRLAESYWEESTTEVTANTLVAGDYFYVNFSESGTSIVSDCGYEAAIALSSSAIWDEEAQAIIDYADGIDYIYLEPSQIIFDDIYDYSKFTYDSCKFKAINTTNYAAVNVEKINFRGAQITNGRINKIQKEGNDIKFGNSSTCGVMTLVKNGSSRTTLPITKLQFRVKTYSSTAWGCLCLKWAATQSSASDTVTHSVYKYFAPSDSYQTITFDKDEFGNDLNIDFSSSNTNYIQISSHNSTVQLSEPTYSDRRLYMSNMAVQYGAEALVWEEIGANTASMIEITYNDLKILRDNSHLNSGQFYRITDYQCTTAQSDTQSAGHAFDIIVVADDVNKLNENARAILHSGDTYFASSKLGAWELKYCLDNDTNRFAWASSSGKGVIYYMKDEYNNECPYDFKNIQFKRKLTDGEYDPTSGTDTWCYTFNAFNSDDSSIKDASVIAFKENIDDGCNECFGNIIKVYYEDPSPNKNSSLNDIVFLNVYASDSYFYCNSNTFGDNCNYNTFGNYCYSNTFGNYCQNNTFGNECNSNTFGNNCFSNTFGNNCFSNTFGNNCYDNTFGNYCYSNTFGNDCYSNTFGNDCYSNTFGNNCNSNTFGNDCYSNTFGDGALRNKLVATGNTGYARYNIFENGVRYVDLQASSAGSRSSYLQNLRVRQGVVGASTLNLKVITEVRNLSHDVTYRAIGAEDKAI